MHHLATDFSWFLNDGIIESFILDVVVIEITASTNEDQIWLHEKSKHFVERRVHAWPVDA